MGVRKIGFLSNKSALSIVVAFIALAELLLCVGAEVTHRLPSPGTILRRAFKPGSRQQRTSSST